MTRASSLESYFSPDQLHPVDPVLFAQFDNLWSQMLALIPELRKTQSKDPHEVPSFCGACLKFIYLFIFSREKDSAIPFPCRP